MEQDILITLRGKNMCPKCNNELLEVIRNDGAVEKYCTRWKKEKIKCNYFTTHNKG